MNHTQNVQLGYMVPQFPSQTHAFFWREANALADWLGHPVHWISTARPPAGSCRHAFAAAAADNTFYIFPPTFKGLLCAAKRPKGLLDAIGYVLQLKQSSCKEKLKLMGMLACVGNLIEHCKQLNIRHVHVHSLGNTMHILAMAHLISGLKFSGTLHGQPALYGVDFSAKCRYAEFISCVTTQNAKELAQETGADPASYPITIMGVDTGEFVPPPHPGDSDTLRLISVSRLSLSKGHDVALDALARAVSAGIKIYYTIVGDGEYREAIEQRIRALGLDQHVTLTGSLGEHEVKTQLAAHDVFILASVGTEAAPVAIMEAMSMGLTVLSSRIGATPEMIDHGRTGFLFEQSNVEQLSDLLQQIAVDRSRLQAIGLAARAHAVEHFDYRRTAAKLYAILKTHLGDS